MAKEWILNSVMNRFQLNFKRNVGATSESIRKCSPRTIDEWRNYYFENVRSLTHIEDLGRKLYTKITEVIQSGFNFLKYSKKKKYKLNPMKNLLLNMAAKFFMSIQPYKTAKKK